MKVFKLRQRMTRTRVNDCRLPEFGWLQQTLWIRRVLVDPRVACGSPPVAFGSSPGGAFAISVVLMGGSDEVSLDESGECSVSLSSQFAEQTLQVR